MTEAKIERLLRKWQALLGLDRWEINLDLAQPAQDGAHASTWRSNNYETATVYLAHPDWRDWADAEAESHVVHELVHLLTRDFEEVLKIINYQLPPAVDKAVEEAFMFRLEQMVDLVARRFIRIAK